MKKTTLLSVLLLILATFVATSCSDDETAKKLNGKWEVTSGIPGMEGMKMYLTFDSEKKTGAMTVGVKAEGMDLMDMKIPYTWDCTSSELTFKLKPEQTSINFSNTFKEMAAASGESLDAIEKQTKDGLIKSMPNLGSNTISEITETRVVLTEGSTTLNLKRVK